MEHAKAAPSAGSKRLAESELPGRSKRLRRVPLDEKAAYKLIRRWISKFLPRTTKKIAARFCGPGGPRSFAQIESEKRPFDQLSEDLRKHDVIETAGDLLLRIIQLCNWGRKDKPLITGTVNAKIYLAAYMIAAKPKNVFDEIGELEQKVIEASRPLLDAFHQTAELLKDGIHWKQIPIAKDLPTLLCTYLRTFKDWKINDEKKLAGRLRRALKGIEETIAKAKESQGASGSSARDLEELEEQRQKLEAKLRQIGGGGVSEAKPQGAGANRGLGGKISSATAATVVKTHNVQDLGAQSSGGGGGGGGMTNEQLAHELLIDSDFKLDDKAGMSDEKLVHTKIRETFERAFWDSLVEDLTCEPPSFAPVLNVLSEIKTGIESLSQNQQESHQIREIIDVEHIKSQLKERSLDFMGCERLIDSIIGVVMNVHGRMKASDRKEETRSKWRECQVEMQEANGKKQSDRARAICKALELVLDRVHKIRVDTANAKLRAIAPVIRQHGVEYEKSHFAKKIANGTITMERTDKWIKHTVEQLLQHKDPVVDIKSTRQAASQHLADLPAKYEGVVHAALVDLVAEYPNWGGEKRLKDREDELPESMMLDLLRVKALNVHFHTDVVSAVILTQVDQEVRNRVRDASVRTKLLKNVADILKLNPPKPSKPQAVIEQVMNEISPHLSEQDRSITQNLIDKHVQKTHPVYAHMVKQFKLAWFHKLAGNVSYSLKVPESAQCMEQETLKHAQFLCTVALLNLRVHTHRYNQMLNKILGVDTKTTAAATPAAEGDKSPHNTTGRPAGSKSNVGDVRIWDSAGPAPGSSH